GDGGQADGEPGRGLDGQPTAFIVVLIRARAAGEGQGVGVAGGQGGQGRGQLGGAQREGEGDAVVPRDPAGQLPGGDGHGVAVRGHQRQPFGGGLNVHVLQRLGGVGVGRG